MAEEIQEAVQIIRVAYEGIEIAIKIGSGGFSVAKKALETLIGLLEHEKTMGKTSMKKLLLKGGDLQVFQYKSSEAKELKKRLKKYGILYTELPDINKKDGMSEIIFHAEAVPRMNMIAKKLTHGKIGSFDEYVQNGDEKELEKLLKFLKGQKRGKDLAPTEEAAIVNDRMDDLIQQVGIFATEKQQISVEDVRENFNIGHVEAQDVLGKLEQLGVLEKNGEQGIHVALLDQAGFEERMKGYSQLLDRMQVISTAKDGTLMDITISKTLIQEENDRAVKTRVPGTWGEQVKYLWTSKENMVEIHDGKTLLTFLDPNKGYKLYDKDNRVVEVVEGQALYDKHYDKVEAAVRERYEKSQRQGQKSKPPRQNKRR